MLLFDRMGETQRKVIQAIGPKMDVTNVAEYFYKHDRERWLPTDFPWPKPPFKNMWVEYRYPRTTYSKEVGVKNVEGYSRGLTPYFGCFVSTAVEFVPGDKHVTIRNFQDKPVTEVGGEPPKGEYGVYGGVWYVDNRDNAKMFGKEISVRFDIGPDGKISKVYHAGTILPKQEDLETRIYEIYPVLMAFSFGNCKNIEVVQVDPPPKLNKARERRGNRPLVSYKVINVLPFGRAYNPTKRTVVGDGAGVALHIRAGNFARYGEAYGRKKLFGKYEGMFWRPQAMVGSAERGVSVHDYEVSRD